MGKHKSFAQFWNFLNKIFTECKAKTETDSFEVSSTLSQMNDM